MRSRKSRPSDTATDPFRERLPQVSRTRVCLLGGTFEFECESARLRRLVDWAYAGLPRHQLSASRPRFCIRLALAPLPERAARLDAPQIGMLSGAGFLGGVTSSSDMAVVSPASRSALVVLSQHMLRFPHHARYELIEFVVFMLAARAQGLVPLHAACVGREGRGLLLMGDSGAGKSTASLHSLLRGLDFVSEDSVLVKPATMLATGVANFLHVRCDSLESLPESTATAIRQSPVIRRRSGVEKFEIDLRTANFRLAARPLKIAGLVFISAQAAHDARLLTRLRRAEVLRRLAATQPYAANQPGWSVFRDRTARIPAFELCRGRHAAEAGDALQSLLTGGSHRARP
jgi:hypothetical protein